MTNAESSERVLPAAICAALALLAGCASPPASAATPDDRPKPPASHYEAVLVAGDRSLPVFDNAAESVAKRLVAGGEVAPGDIRRLSASHALVVRNGMRSASLPHVLDAVAALRPGPGDGCFVFATSHGEEGRGVALAATGQVLGARALDRALAAGCGDAPTVVVVSACFSGSFAAAPMTRPNRIVLTAARADRPSFGCGAGRTYTVFDRCLLDALDRGGTWRGAYAFIRACVAAEEKEDGFPPSEPQAWFGPDVADLPLPVRP